jgi:hypothetical protein
MNKFLEKNFEEGSCVCEEWAAKVYVYADPRFYTLRLLRRSSLNELRRS